MGKSGAGYSSEYGWEGHVRGSGEICTACYDLRDADLLARNLPGRSEMVESIVRKWFLISVRILR